MDVNDGLAARVHALIAQMREKYPFKCCTSGYVDDYYAGQCRGVNKFADALEAALAAALAPHPARTEAE